LATNVKGDSVVSNGGNGAIITAQPGAPTNLAENISVKAPTTIGLTWNPPTFIGGASILDYRVNIASSGAYSVLA